MNRQYILDLDGLDGISDIGHPSSDPVPLNQMDVSAESSDSSKFNRNSPASVAGANTRSSAIAVLVAGGLIGLVSFIVLLIGESDIGLPSVSILSDTEPLDELSGHDLELSDRPYRLLAPGYSGNNGSVESPEAGKRQSKVELMKKPFAKAGSDLSTTPALIQNQHKLDAKQFSLPGALQAPAETSSEVVFESRVIKLAEAPSKGGPPTSGKVTQIATSAGVASDIKSKGAFEVGEFVLQFSFNETVLNALSESALRDMKNIAARCPDKIRIVGHTCSRGPFSSNLDVAHMRAMAVKELLLDNEFSADRIEVISAGEKEPIAPNNTRVGRGLNRRVVVDCLTKAKKFARINYE